MWSSDWNGDARVALESPIPSRNAERKAQPLLSQLPSKNTHYKGNNKFLESPNYCEPTCQSLGISTAGSLTVRSQDFAITWISPDSVGFITSFNGSQFAVLLKFTPFRRHCNFVFHEYTLRSWLLEDATPCTAALARSTIVNSAQKIYDTYFKETLLYAFRFSEEEVEFLEREVASQDLSANRSNPVELIQPQGDHIAHTTDSAPTGIDKVDKRKTAYKIAKNVAFKPSATPSPFDEVVKSYRLAQSSRTLKCPWLPKIGTLKKPVYKAWDPYQLTPKKDFLRQSYLDEKRLEEIKKHV
ncbi:hypothetical protein B0J14DRAFT_652771 [Halenospora varia]|nr:hypothetical protein B0J14DRAFT_652771 [Halenospora varia]